MVDEGRAATRIQSSRAARALGVSQRTVQTLALRGELPGAARIGGVWTFDAAKLSAFIAQRERDAESRATNVVPFPSPQPRQTRAQTSAAYAKLMAGRRKIAA